MDPHAMTLNWLDSKPLYEAATLTTFYSGNAANGKTMAVVVQESYYPTVYAVLGKAFVHGIMSWYKIFKACIKPAF